MLRSTRTLRGRRCTGTSTVLWIGLASVMALPTSALASLYSTTFSGTFTETQYDTGYDGPIKLNDEWTITYLFDTDDPPFNNRSVVYTPRSAMLTVGAESISLTPSYPNEFDFWIFVIGGHEFHSIYMRTVGMPSWAGLRFPSLEFNLWGPVSFLPGPELPTSLDITESDGSLVSLGGGCDGQADCAITFLGEVESVNIVPVPEPTSVLLFSMCAVSAACLKIRRRLGRG